MSKTELNHCLILGVEPDATQAEIEDAFERSSTQREESVAIEGTPAARSERIGEAYALLRDLARQGGVRQGPGLCRGPADGEQAPPEVLDDD